MGLMSWLIGGQPKPHSTDVVAQIKNGPGTFSLDVVGESHYQGNLGEICGGKCQDGHRLEVMATLVLYNNPYDRNAVMVVINDLPVGHLDREAAKMFRKELNKVAPGVKYAQCPALIVGGWDRGGQDTGHFGVKLDLPVKL